MESYSKQGLSKHLLRSELRARRGRMDPDLWQRSSLAIQSHLLSLPMLQAAAVIGLFWPMIERREVDLRMLLGLLNIRGKRIGFPFASADGATGLRSATCPEDLVVNRWGFSEPRQELRELPATEVDLIVVPCLAATLAGHRLGYGAGYYDRLLPRFPSRTTTVAVCYASEILAALPVEPHDVACNWVVTNEHRWVAHE